MDFMFLQYIWLFFIYAFLGWVVEVSFHTFTSRKFVNRGFLNGPLCPIYGFGMIILIYFLNPFVDNLILLFLGSFLLTTILEFITGFILESIFDTKWWDYSETPFNIKGYVSLSFSIVWGLAAVFMLNIVHPPIDNFVASTNNKIGNFILIVLILNLIADFIVTLLGILEINKQMRILNKIASGLKAFSDDVGENIYNEVAKAIKAKDSVSSKFEEGKIALAKLEKEYDELAEKKSFVFRRLEKSFPNIKEKISSLEKHRFRNNK